MKTSASANVYDSKCLFPSLSINDIGKPMMIRL